MSRKISDLPKASFPAHDEYLMPVCIDNTATAVGKISISAIVESITSFVLAGGEVELVVTESGIKFKKLAAA
jgi:hypothetical protein